MIFRSLKIIKNYLDFNRAPAMIGSCPIFKSVPLLLTPNFECSRLGLLSVNTTS